MEYLKMLSLTAVAVAALLASIGAGTASATTLEDGAGKLPINTFIKAQLESGTISNLTTAYKNIECSESELTASTTNETGHEVFANAAWTFGKCNCEVKVLAGGTISVTWIGGNDGNLTSSGTEITTSCITIVGTVHCIYVTTSTPIGVLTGSASTGATATIDINGANIPRLSTHAACQAKAKWDANYLVESPDTLNVIN